MKFTLSWLNEHLETDATIDDIVEAMTLAGLEVEGVDHSAQLRRDALVLDRLQAGAVHVPDSGLPYVS